VDSPAQSFTWNPGDGGGNNWYEANANDSFKVWAMFKPPSVQSQPTTWIPMAKYTWQWSGAAEKQGGTWVLTASGGGNDGQPVDSKEHPEWTTFSPSPFNLWGVP
jgi:hypothetical protein